MNEKKEVEQLRWKQKMRKAETETEEKAAIIIVAFEPPWDLPVEVDRLHDDSMQIYY